MCSTYMPYLSKKKRRIRIVRHLPKLAHPEFLKSQMLFIKSQRMYPKCAMLTVE